MIEKVVLRNFRGIREGELELAPLTIFWVVIILVRRRCLRRFFSS